MSNAKFVNLRQKLNPDILIWTHENFPRSHCAVTKKSFFFNLQEVVLGLTEHSRLYVNNKEVRFCILMFLS